jgi:hypothetical protein
VLLREDERGWLAIGQPSHAWISGQLARAWGNARFGGLEPFEDVCLAAEQHDVGWAGRDLEPLYNPETGLPRAFLEMPLDIHVGLFTDGPRRLLSQSRYAALLVSMHGSRLYRRRDLERLPTEDAETIRAFLEDQRSFQDELIESLDADRTGLARSSLLIWAWDYVSLTLCLDWAPAIAKGCPTADGTVEVAIDPGPTPGQVSVEPWPFATSTLTVRCEGRRLTERFDREDEMLHAFAEAPWETLSFELVPASGSTPPAPRRHSRGP